MLCPRYGRRCDSLERLAAFWTSLRDDVLQRWLAVGKRLRERSDAGNEADGSLYFVANLLNQFVDLRPRIMFGGGFQG